MLLTRSPLYSLPEGNFPARLACVRHAASVRSEPGSNSPVETIGTDPRGESETKRFFAVAEATVFEDPRTHSRPELSRGRKRILTYSLDFKDRCHDGQTALST